MIGIDTNVLLRYLAQDDPTQSAKAERFLDSLTPQSPGFISLLTFTELYWVLDHSFKLSRTEISALLHDLLAAATLVFEQHPLIASALTRYLNGKADLDDYLIAASAQQAGCECIVTFDQTAAKDGLMLQLI